MDNPIQVDLGRIAQDLQIRRVQVESVVQLLDDGNSVPFITRYRKERTGNLNEVVIREIQLRVQRLRDLAERKETILKAIEAQGKLDPDLAAAIRAADSPKRLEDLYLPFKPKKRTKASDARDRGLEPLAFRIWTRDETLTDLAAAAQEFVNAESGVESIEKVLEGVGHILAEAISEMAAVRDNVRKVVWKTGRIVTSKGEIPEGQGLEYRDYFAYSEPISQIPPHRVLAINRGDKEGPLKVRLDVSRPDVEAALFTQLPLESHPHAEFFRVAAIDALDRLILPSMEREVRRDLTESAEKHAVDVFARNLRSLLLQPPIPNQIVMAIDPGFRTGCKVAVLDQGGNLLDHGVTYPHPPQNRRSDAKIFIKDLVGKHKVGVVAIGNGTACRETEELVAEIIAEGTRFSLSGAEAEPAPPAEHPPAAGSVADSASGALAPEIAEILPTVDSDAGKRSGDLNAQHQTPLLTPDLPGSGAVLEHPTVEPSQVEQQVAWSAPADNSESEAATGANSDHHDDTHAPGGPEVPLEALPPISGGAPESSSPEAELDAPASGPPTSEASGATATILNDHHDASNDVHDHQSDDPPADVEPSANSGESAGPDQPEANASTEPDQSEMDASTGAVPSGEGDLGEGTHAPSPSASAPLLTPPRRPITRQRKPPRGQPLRRPLLRSRFDPAGQAIRVSRTALDRLEQNSRLLPRRLRRLIPPMRSSPSLRMSWSMRPGPVSTRPARSGARSYPTATPR